LNLRHQQKKKKKNLELNNEQNWTKCRKPEERKKKTSPSIFARIVENQNVIETWKKIEMDVAP